MSLNDIKEHPVLASQSELLDSIVRDIRPMVIVDEVKALRNLVEIFMEDTDRAATTAAFAVIELAKLNPFWSVTR